MTIAQTVMLYSDAIKQSCRERLLCVFDDVRVCVDYKPQGGVLVVECSVTRKQQELMVGNRFPLEMLRPEMYENFFRESLPREVCRRMMDEMMTRFMQ